MKEPGPEERLRGFELWREHIVQDVDQRHAREELHGGEDGDAIPEVAPAHMQAPADVEGEREGKEDLEGGGDSQRDEKSRADLRKLHGGRILCDQVWSAQLY